MKLIEALEDFYTIKVNGMPENLKKKSDILMFLSWMILLVIAVNHSLIQEKAFIKSVFIIASESNRLL